MFSIPVTFSNTTSLVNYEPFSGKMEFIPLIQLHLKSGFRCKVFSGEEIILLNRVFLTESSKDLDSCTVNALRTFIMSMNTKNDEQMFYDIKQFAYIYGKNSIVTEIALESCYLYFQKESIHLFSLLRNKHGDKNVETLKNTILV